MLPYSFISPEIRAYVRFLRERDKLTVRKVADLTGISKSSVSRICSSPLRHITLPRETKVQMGRPSKLSARQRRLILKEVRRARRTHGNFTVRTLMNVLKSDLQNVSVRTISRFLNQSGYKYRIARKKGLLYAKDLRRRLQFARVIKRERGPSFWTDDIAFYFDATSFHHKTHPKQNALTLKGRVWRKHNEGLSFGCTAKGRKVGSGGRVVRVHAAISYGNGVVLAKPYKKLTGKRFAKFVKKEFDGVFGRCQGDHIKPRVFVQDGDPSQNSARVRRALSRINATIQQIPARSPDLNPIENIFHILGNRLNEDALRLNIEHETFRAFRRRVVTTLLGIPPSVVDKTIGSMTKRVDEIIRRKGERLKY